MINIMQIVHDLNFGGMQRVVVDLCLKSDPSKFNMSVCCFEELGPNARELQSAGIPVFLIKKKSGIDFALPFKLRTHFSKYNIDIVHTHGINPFFYGTIGAKLAGNIKTVQTDHARGIFPVAPKEMFSEMVVSWFADRIIAVSEGVKSDLVKYEHINKDKIQVIYNGIDAAKYRVSIDKNRKRKEFGIKKEDKVIGIGVRLEEQKGIAYLIQAAGELVESFSNLKLLIIGDGELRSEMEDLAVQLGIENKVIFTGFRTDIPELLQIIDIYVLPSLFEGHPLVLLEAMAASKPIVATDIPGNRETVADGKTGLLVPLRNSEELAIALKLLLKNDEFRIKMGMLGCKKYQSQFTIDNMIQQYNHLYESFTKKTKCCLQFKY